MKRIISLVLALTALLLVGCGGSPSYKTPLKGVSQREYSTQYGPSPHAPGFATQGPKTKAYSLAPSATPTLEMFDSIENNFPSGSQAIAGYVGGIWPTATESFFTNNRAPHKVTIAINAYERADCLDDEPGDATPYQVVGWVRAELNAGQAKPCVYASVSNFSLINGLLAQAGLSNSIRRWCAWYRYVPGLVSGCDAVQWTDHAYGINLDESTVALSFFGPPPPPPDPHHYLWFSAAKLGYHTHQGIARMNEQDIVKQYDTRRPHHSQRDARLQRLEFLLRVLANHVYAVATSTSHHDWTTAHRGWRYQELIHRTHGAQVV